MEMDCLQAVLYSRHWKHQCQSITREKSHSKNLMKFEMHFMQKNYRSKITNSHLMPSSSICMGLPPLRTFPFLHGLDLPSRHRNRLARTYSVLAYTQRTPAGLWPACWLSGIWPAQLALWASQCWHRTDSDTGTRWKDNAPLPPLWTCGSIITLQ